MSTPSWGSSTPPPQYAPAAAPKKSKAKGCLGIGCGGLVAIAIIGGIAAAVSGSKAATATTPSGNIPVATSASTEAAVPVKKSTEQTVTYAVTGSSADVQYGASGSSNQGSVPMSVTSSLGDPAYYNISAQLQGSGSVTCKLKVDGKVISQATASGGYNIAMCEIVQDPISGNWQDANSG